MVKTYHQQTAINSKRLVGAKKAAVEWSLHLGLHIHDTIPAAGAISDEKRIISDEAHFRLLPRLTTVVWYDFQIYQPAERD
jgi:hypothetical protein